MVEAAEVSQPEIVDIDILIQENAKKYHLNYDHFYKTLYFESGGFKDVAIQSSVIEEDGKREDSWGICQIHLGDDNPGVTKEMAIRPEWCIPYTAEKWSKGQHHLWHAYDYLQKRNWKL